MKNIFLNLALLGLLVVSSSAFSNEHPAFPVDDGQVHKGVATCASSVCHGAVSKRKESAIQHNEYILWERQDAHSLAYKKLFNKDFKAITKKLGLKEPHKEPVCLACHASNVKKELRGKKFQMRDGIGCETCHGGSEHWLKSHTDKTANHEKNLKNGLYPTDDIVARARLCSSCHYGNAKQFVTHDIMGAGHPRISFELDTFTEVQPRHFTQDEDYKKRKKFISSVKAWAVGQAIAVDSMLDVTLSKTFDDNGMFPELSMYDCYSCHHPMSKKSWTHKQNTNLKPGDVPVNDASFMMFQHVISQVDKKRAWRFKSLLKKLHAASRKNRAEFKQVAREIRADMPALIDSVAKHDFTLANIKDMTQRILKQGISDGFTDYIVAEQSVMALTSLVVNWDTIKPLSKIKRDKANKEIDKMYEVVDKDESYNARSLRSSMVKLRDTLFK